MSIEKERELFEEKMCHKLVGAFNAMNNHYNELTDQLMWEAWQAAKAESHKSASLYQWEINHLAAANQQWRDYAAKASVVPDGFCIVPKEPTDKQKRTAMFTVASGGNAIDAYREMIKDAQEQDHDN